MIVGGCWSPSDGLATACRAVCRAPVPLASSCVCKYAVFVDTILPLLGALTVFGVVFGLFSRAHDRAQARRIAEEVAARTSHDPVLLLAELQRLREVGAVSDEEFQQQKARILKHSLNPFTEPASLGRGRDLS